MSESSCPVCHSDITLQKYHLYDDRYGYDKGFRLDQCQQCQHCYLLHDLTTNDFERLYTDYYPRAAIRPEQVMPLHKSGPLKSWFTGERARACLWVPPDVKVLDIGCGAGETLLYHRNRGCDIAGTETDKNVAAIASYHNLPIDFGPFNKDHFDPASFDYITLDQVVEHLIDPCTMLAEIAYIMKQDAQLIISTPNASGAGVRLFGKKWVNWHAPYHLHFFSRQSMQRLAAKADLEVIEYKQITSSDWLYFQCLHLFTYPEQGEKSLFWQNLPLPDKRQALMRRACNILKNLGLFSLVTRFFDIIGKGDNQLFILRKKSSVAA